MKKHFPLSHRSLWLPLLITVFMSYSVQADDLVDAGDFIDKASAKGIAEMEAGHLALRESSNAEVEKFARAMISDHGAIHRELIRLAKQKDLAVADEADLINQAKLSMMKVRDGESFDIAYARNQVTTHEEAIALFQQARHLGDSDISSFAEKNLPTLEEHLVMANKLLERLTPPGTELPPLKTFDIPAHNDQPDAGVLQPAPKEVNPSGHNDRH